MIGGVAGNAGCRPFFWLQREARYAIEAWRYTERADRISHFTVSRLTVILNLITKDGRLPDEGRHPFVTSFIRL